jgi:hypothetical protein
VVLRCPGGRQQLCELVDEYGKELRGDLERFYGLDLADAWRGRLTARRVLDIAEHLHTEHHSRYRAALLGDPRFVGWTPTDDLLADQFELAQSVAGVLDAKVVPYPRPQVKAKPKPSSFAEFDIHAAVRQTS